MSSSNPESEHQKRHLGLVQCIMGHKRYFSTYMGSLYFTLLILVKSTNYNRENLLYYMYYKT